VILPEGAYQDWLDAPPQFSMEFMQPFPAERMQATPEPSPPKPRAAAKARPTPETDPPLQGDLGL
jgi:putative SOS response-associated peptidase YedK